VKGRTGWCSGAGYTTVASEVIKHFFLAAARHTPEHSIRQLEVGDYVCRKHFPHLEIGTKTFKTSTPESICNEVLFGEVVQSSPKLEDSNEATIINQLAANKLHWLIQWTNGSQEIVDPTVLKRYKDHRQSVDKAALEAFQKERKALQMRILRRDEVKPISFCSFLLSVFPILMGGG
jgi:hypothetical protein